MKKIFLTSLLILLVSSCNFPGMQSEAEKKAQEAEQAKVIDEKQGQLQTGYNEARRNPEFLKLENEYNEKMGAGDKAGMEAVRQKMESFYTDDMKNLQKDLKLKD